jgi:hypothetical protein
MKLKLSLLLLFIVFSIDILESIEVTDFCQKKELNGIKPECQGFFNISCDSNLCAKKESTCQDINSLFRSKSNFYRYEKDFIKYAKQYKLLLKQIKECAKPAEYNWNPNDVCLNTKYCVNTLITLRSFYQVKVRECKCRGKYSYRCDDYCALDKKACDGLKKVKKIKKCL